MSFDIYGKNPANKTGEYYQNSNWGWRPLAYYLCKVGGNVAERCTSWQYNDGKGLDAESSLELAALVRKHISDGHAQAYIDGYNSAKNYRVPCWICMGTGKREDREFANRCNGCQGEKYQANPTANYDLTLDEINRFLAFLESCGGFTIN